MKKYTTTSLVILLAPLVFSFAIGQDIFVPEVPQMLGIFHTSQGMVQLTLSLFMLAAGAGQLLIGPLSDQFGRRKIVLFSIALYTVGSVIAALASTIGVLIFARILEGIGACGMMVCAFAVVRDVISGNEAGKVYSYLNGAIAISPLFAPLIGGYLDVWFGWRAPFIALAALGSVVFMVMLFFLSETQKPEHKIKLDAKIFQRYWQVIKNSQFRVYSFAAASTLACFFTFFSVSSYILIGILHIPETHFGYYFGAIGLIFFFSSIAAGRLCMSIGVFRVALIGAITFFACGAWMLIWTLIAGTSIMSFMLPVAVSSIAGALMMGAGAAGALEPFAEMAGTASALLGAFQFLLATAVGSFIMHWRVESNLSYAIPLTVFGALISIAVVLFQLTSKAR